MSTERSVFAQSQPGFPNLSAIRERLILNDDTSVLATWRDGFDDYAKAVLKMVEQTGRCTENQANLLANESLVVAQRRTRPKAR